VSDEPLVTLEITLRRFLTPEGRMAWQFRASNDANALDMLGLLQAAILWVNDQMKDQP
jgi:hypothetical protein